MAFVEGGRITHTSSDETARGGESLSIDFQLVLTETVLCWPSMLHYAPFRPAL